MRISRRRFQRRIIKVEPLHRHRFNLGVVAPQVRLIDEQGQNQGVVDTPAALAMARERGLDLVEVASKAKPPVAKIVDYSKFRYQEEKERRKEKAKQKEVEVKSIRLSLRIGEHDLEVRRRAAVTFLEDNDKVKIEIILRGRERAHADVARGVIAKFIERLNEQLPIRVEQEVGLQEGRLTAMIGKAS